MVAIKHRQGLITNFDIFENETNILNIETKKNGNASGLHPFRIINNIRKPK